MTNDPTPLSVYTNDKFCHLDPITNAICYTIKALFEFWSH